MAADVDLIQLCGPDILTSKNVAVVSDLLKCILGGFPAKTRSVGFLSHVGEDLIDIAHFHMGHRRYFRPKGAQCFEFLESNVKGDAGSVSSGL